jgi:hypothetical protein
MGDRAASHERHVLTERGQVVRHLPGIHDIFNIKSAIVGLLSFMQACLMQEGQQLTARSGRCSSSPRLPEAKRTDT